jgi:alpha-tubulin suppressor-like RCC1 family protein
MDFPTSRIRWRKNQRDWAEGSAKCAGDDAHGQVSDAPPYRLFTELALGDDHACGLKPDGLLSCWGSNRLGQLDWPLPSEL